MKQPIFHYSSATCGAGKTKWAISEMANQPKRYIYAVDRTDVFNDRINLILEAAQAAKTTPAIRSLSSKAGDSVNRDFPITISDNSHHQHVVLIVTHEALKLVDHAIVEAHGWDLIIDEDPKLWASATLDLGASEPFWRANYNLTDANDGYAVIRLKADAPTWRQVNYDILTRPIAAFHDRVRKRDVIVDITSWDQLQTRERLTYFNVWDVSELMAYDRVTILANSFDRLVSYRLIRALYPSIQMVPISIGRPATWVERDVTVNYFATDHRAGSTFFQTTEDGQRAVKLWSAWVRLNTKEANHYWSANKARGDLKLPGAWVSPKISGSNDYREKTECSVLYSAKASKAENKVFAHLTGDLIDGDAVRRDREFEDLIQIVFRSSLRMADDSRPVSLNVYDEEQAQFLADYFAQAGFPFRTRLVHHDIGVRHQKSKPGRKPNPNRMTSTERSRAHRARKAATLTPPIN